ncbi:discoidin domain-containing protein [Streptococcus equi]|uniref:discoidin domain-containing protein n=1 Tax=Streptococcus equi TaxID=1336 RepID=UPI001E2BEDDC|nr:discoidin domain-containing protein [Streptococcus equi]
MLMSNQQSGKHMVDGRDMATQWHTLFNQVTEDKSYTVEFKDDRSFSAIAYLPGGVNGMIHSAKVEISSDGKVWTTVVDSTDWKQNTELKTVSFTPTTGRFVRITALDTYGKSSGQANNLSAALLIASLKISLAPLKHRLEMTF